MPPITLPGHNSETLPARQLLLPLVLLMLSFILRLQLISKGPYHVDCLALAGAAEATFETGRLHLQFGPGYPLTVLLGAIFVGITRMFGNTDPVWAVNLMSVVCSSASVVILYFIAQRLFDTRSALFAAIMFSIFPIFLGISVYGKSHTPSLMFWLIAVLFAIRYRSRGYQKEFIMSSLFFGLMGAARIQDMFLVMPAWLFLCLEVPIPQSQFKKRDWKMIIIGAMIAVGIALLFHLWQIAQNRDVYTQQLGNFWTAVTVNHFRGLFTFYFGWSLWMIIFGLSPIGALLCLLGLTRLLLQQPKLLIFLLIWTMIPLFFYGNLFTIAPRFLMIAIIPLILFQGYFFGYLVSLKSPLYKLLTLLSFGVIVWLILGQMLPILQFRHRYDLLPEFGRTIGQLTEPNAVIIGGDEAAFLSHYGNRKLLLRPLNVYSYKEEELTSFREKLDQLLKDGVPVYITNSGLKSYDPDHLISDLIQKNYKLELTFERYSEEWHNGETLLWVGKERLYKIFH